MTAEEKLKRPVSFSFQHWLTEFIGDGDNVAVLNDTAALLSVIDSSEEFIHVEYPNEINNFQRPVVWRIKAWRESQKRYEQFRHYTELERQVWLEEQDAIKRLLRQLNHHYPPINKDMKHINEDEASRQVKARNLKRIKFYSVNLDDLLRADRDLADYRRKLKEKRTGQKI